MATNIAIEIDTIISTALPQICNSVLVLSGQVGHVCVLVRSDI